MVEKCLSGKGDFTERKLFTYSHFNSCSRIFCFYSSPHVSLELRLHTVRDTLSCGGPEAPLPTMKLQIREEEDMYPIRHIRILNVLSQKIMVSF